jgi:hypothetical protein
MTLNPCDGTYTGTGMGYDPSMNPWAPETIASGSYANGEISFTAVGARGFSWTLTNAPTDGTTVLASTNPAVSWPVHARVTLQSVTTSDYKNHGDYVSSVGGGSDAAHSCIGMPINSSN